MFKRIADLKVETNIGKEITLRGWVHRLRKQKEKTFIILRDDRGDIIQAVCPSEFCDSLTTESSIKITGKLSKDKRAPEGGYELKVERLNIIHISNTDYPIGEFQSDEILLDYRHLALRTRKMINVGKIRSSLLRYAREWFLKEDLMEVTPPILVKSAVEGGATLFKLNYFDETAYLSQSSQLYLESMIYCLGPVWSLTPSFRAEKSRTVRHLAEFTHLEAEVPWINMNELINMQEQLIFSIIKDIRKNNRKEIEFLKPQAINKLDNISIPFERISYNAAVEFLRSKECKIKNDDGNERTIEWGDDLNIDAERELTRGKTNPVFITNYPIKVKPFYVKHTSPDDKTGLAVDLLAPYGYGEISGGGIREDNYERLLERIRGSDLNPNDYEWYLDLRKYGSIPHGGFGIGIERVLRWILDFDDIKDVVLFPRTKTRIYP